MSTHPRRPEESQIANEKHATYRTTKNGQTKSDGYASCRDSIGQIGGVIYKVEGTSNSATDEHISKEPISSDIADPRNTQPFRVRASICVCSTRNTERFAFRVVVLTRRSVATYGLDRVRRKRFWECCRSSLTARCADCQTRAVTSIDRSIDRAPSISILFPHRHPFSLRVSSRSPSLPSPSSPCACLDLHPCRLPRFTPLAYYIPSTRLADRRFVYAHYLPYRVVSTAPPWSTRFITVPARSLGTSSTNALD